MFSLALLKIMLAAVARIFANVEVIHRDKGKQCFGATYERIFSIDYQNNRGFIFFSSFAFDFHSVSFHL